MKLPPSKQATEIGGVLGCRFSGCWDKVVGR
jgi:hypothetical protein